MTKEEDKLVALLGVADEFGQALGDQLVAGLWKNRLLEELCWRRTDTHPCKYICPTRSFCRHVVRLYQSASCIALSLNFYWDVDNI